MDTMFTAAMLISALSCAIAYAFAASRIDSDGAMVPAHVWNTQKRNSRRRSQT